MTPKEKETQQIGRKIAYAKVLKEAAKLHAKVFDDEDPVDALEQYALVTRVDDAASVITHRTLKDCEESVEGDEYGGYLRRDHRSYVQLHGAGVVVAAKKKRFKKIKITEEQADTLAEVLSGLWTEPVALALERMHLPKAVLQRVYHAHEDAVVQTDSMRLEASRTAAEDCAQAWLALDQVCLAVFDVPDAKYKGKLRPYVWTIGN